MEIQEKMMSPAYHLGRFDALNEVLFRIKTREVELKSKDYVLGIYETCGIINDYFNELSGESR